MIPGPDIVIECPHCRSLSKLFSLTSGNTFGATLWSDGYQDAPMLPRPPVVTRCHNCSGYFWVRDAKEVGEIDPFERKKGASDTAWEEALSIRELTESEYYEAIEAGLASTSENETQIRTLAWWRANDTDRIEEKGSRKLEQSNPQKTANLILLFDVMKDDSAEGQLMKAEVARQLGRFDDAITLLSAIRNPELEWVKTQIIAFCESRNINVRVLRMDA